MNTKDFLENKEHKIILFPDQILSSVCQEIKKEDFSVWKQIVPIMFDLMIEHKGIGLAAPQIGLLHKMFIMNVTRPIVVINPEIIEFGDRKIEEMERCLSLPGFERKVSRSHKIKVKWIDLYSEKQITTQFSGITSRVFQHEFDHLFGKLINDK